MSYRARTAYDDPVAYDRHRSKKPKHRRVLSRENLFLEAGLQQSSVAGEHVLDVACGTGRIGGELARHGMVVTGADVSLPMLTGARTRLGQAPVLVQADATALPFAADSFDGVTSFRLMGHLPADIRRQVLAEIARVTRDWVILTHNDRWSLESLANAPGRWLRPLVKPGAPPSPRQPVSQAQMREELLEAGLHVQWIRPCGRFRDEECVLLARKVTEPRNQELLSQVARAETVRRLGGSHGGRVVAYQGQQYVVKLEAESLGSYLLYWGRVQSMGLLADDVIAPLSRRDRIRTATRAMQEWRERGFAAPEPLNGPEDDLLCYPFLDHPTLRSVLEQSPNPAEVVGVVAAEIFRRHGAAGPAPFGRDRLLFHLDSRCANILMKDGQPVWVDFDRGFYPSVPPVMLKVREVVSFSRSIARLAPPDELGPWLSAIVRQYPDPEVWNTAVQWLQKANGAWQKPAAWLRQRKAASFQSRSKLALTLQSVIDGGSS